MIGRLRQFAILALALLQANCGEPGGEASRPRAATGIMVGEVTDSSAFVQVRLSAADEPVEGDLPGAPGVVEFFLRREPGPGDTALERVVKASPGFDHIARASFEGLSPGTWYACATRVGRKRSDLKPGPVARFRTLPGPAGVEPVRFVIVTGMNYAKFHGDDRIDRAQHLVENNTALPPAYTGPDKALGYPALASILALRPHFFIGTGDNVYYDTPEEPRAETVAQLRRKWHEQFVQPRFCDLFAGVPTYWMIDDHDYRVDDGDNSGDYDPSPEAGRATMLEQLPLAAHGDRDALTYRTHRICRDLQVWFSENRMHRSDNAMADGPGKSIWGARQKQWLESTLLESDAKYKVLVSPTPMIGPDDLRKTDNHTNHGGFRHERDEFFAWLVETGLATKNFYIICGDRHWQYHSIDSNGIEEFSCGALVDENSRLGRKPGDPDSTDPAGSIRQPYLQHPASGGFLLVDLVPGAAPESPKLSFSWHDEHGVLLHTVAR